MVFKPTRIEKKRKSQGARECREIVSGEGRRFGPLTSAQIRVGRALLRWSAEDLARQSLLSVATIRRAELTDSETSMTVANDMVVGRTLEAAGVVAPAYACGKGKEKSLVVPIIAP
jgi:hypothetical protein